MSKFKIIFGILIFLCLSVACQEQESPITSVEPTNVAQEESEPTAISLEALESEEVEEPTSIPTSTIEPTAEPTEIPTSTPIPPTLEPTADPIVSKELVLLGNNPSLTSLDPARHTGTAGGYVGLLYSGLVILDPTLQVQPDLAESWEISEDGTIYTFILREDIAFASGKSITAQDIIASWERATAPETESTTANTYLGDILGVEEKLDGDASTIAGLNPIDERTLEVTLTDPIPSFLTKLAYPTSFVVDIETVTNANDNWIFNINPSGPYILDEFVADEFLSFRSNESYHSPPAISEVIYLISTEKTGVELFAEGAVDIVSLRLSDALQISDSTHPLRDNLFSTTDLCTPLVAINNQLPPMDDPNIRLAFALAADRDGLNQTLANGAFHIATTILPPELPGFSPELAQEWETAVFNEEAAREALAASAYADGLPPIIISAGGFEEGQRADISLLIDDWREVLGAEVTMSMVDPNNFEPSLQENRGHLVSYGWCADYPDPENFLDVMYHSESIFNVGGYINPEIDTLLEEARSVSDTQERFALYQEIETMLLADGAVIPLAHTISNSLVSDQLEGYVETPMGIRIIPYLSFIASEDGE